jgi:hypothetical protein
LRNPHPVPSFGDDVPYQLVYYARVGLTISPRCDEDRLSLEWEELLEDPYGLAGQAEALGGVRVAAPMLWVGGILGTGDETASVRVSGMIRCQKPAYRFGTGSSPALSLVRTIGEVSSSGSDWSRVWGWPLAIRSVCWWALSTGNRTRQSLPYEAPYATGVPSYDESTVFLPLSKAHVFTRAGERANAIFILLDRREDADAVAAALALPSRSVLTWRDLNRALMQSMAQSPCWTSNPDRLCCRARC